MPPGFEMNNSPAELVRRSDVSRPLIVLSSSGTKLIDASRQSDAVYIGCLRNFADMARYVAERHSRCGHHWGGKPRRVSRRRPDVLRMDCAPTHGKGVSPRKIPKRWRWSSAGRLGLLEGILTSASADYLIQSGQGRDLEFVLSHVGDLDDAFILDGDEVIEASAQEIFILQG